MNDNSLIYITWQAYSQEPAVATMLPVSSLAMPFLLSM